MMHSYQQSRQPEFPMTFLFPTNEGCRENPPAERLVISVNTGTRCAQVPPTLRKSDSCFCTQKQVAGYGARENPDRRVGRGSLAPFLGQQRIGQLGALSAPLTPPDRPRESAPGSGGPSMGRKRARAPGRELLPSKAAPRATPNLKCYRPECSGDLSPFKGPPLGIKRLKLPLSLTAGNCSHPHTKNLMQALHMSQEQAHCREAALVLRGHSTSPTFLWARCSCIPPVTISHTPVFSLHGGSHASRSPEVNTQSALRDPCRAVGGSPPSASSFLS